MNDLAALPMFQEHQIIFAICLLYSFFDYCGTVFLTTVFDIYVCVCGHQQVVPVLAANGVNKFNTYSNNISLCCYLQIDSLQQTPAYNGVQ